MDTSDVLVGALSLRNLIVAPPETPIAQLTEGQTELPRISADLPEEEVLRALEKYNLLAVPVTDDEGHLLGVVTVDDALSAALPDEPRRGRRVRG